MKQPKLLIVSQNFAPAVGGSSILLANLFAEYKGEVMAIAAYPNMVQRDANFLPPCETVYFNPPKIKFLEKYYDHLIRKFHFLIRRFIAKWIRRYKPDVIFSHCPNIDFFICAYQEAKRHNLPFYAHMHDLWEENHNEETYVGKMAIKWEKEILTNAKRVFCMTDVQKEHYEKKYNRSCDLSPHSIPQTILDTAPNNIKELIGAKEKIVLFTGAVSTHMNVDSLKVFSEAMHKLPADYKAILCTSATKESMARQGIDAEKFQLQWVTRAEVHELQEKSAVLFAPLSHKNGAMEEVKTVFSTKLLEYLVSGRPILIFAPKDSFHAISALQGGWAHVVTDDSADTLAKEILNLVNNPDLAQKVVNGALAEAQRRKAATYADELYNFIQEDVLNYVNT